MMKAYVYLLVTILALPSTLSLAKKKVSVLSRNLYLGADFLVLFNPANAEKSIHEVIQNFYSLVQSTDYPSRAKILAEEILDRKPDVVCLQEVFTYSFSDSADGSDASVDTDFLSILLEEIGNQYDVASVVYTSNPIFPYEADEATGADTTFLVIQDSDVILTRKQMTVTASTNDLFSPPLLSLPVESSSSNVPILEVKRGFSSVKLQVGDQVILVANTHLEGSSFLSFQKQQANEFITEMEALSEGTIPTILVGDFNAAPLDPLPSECSEENDTYSLLSCGRLDPFAQANEPTYGTDASLLQLASSLLRIDHIFAAPDMEVVEVEVFGKEPIVDLGGKYPSDHFGLMCILSLPVRASEEDSSDGNADPPTEDSSDEDINNEN